MKNLKLTSLLFITTLFLTSCSSDDDNIEPILEEEVITTLQVTLVGGGSTITMEYKDLDPEGPTDPVVTVSGPLMAGTVYTGSLTLLNELVNPAENITEEILEEAEEHQFFYQVSNTLNITNITYEDSDSNGNPLGLSFSFETGAASAGDFTIILRHEPNKEAEGVSNGDITNADGETDISAGFPLTIQ
ncbi:type 1 periplasmic binding fold superfamily protein [Planktosalinus lacus]|uniref:Type 1 periplasmic binding fold superfamily protein n=1 Tax=Planktosalinus lacus TaxID=1526573 RepID=A0A8J2Y9N6_9FLAO|nr:type 1 periplasmic binding fold superfamily protein [Planktosalinus lacus]GGD92918.1 hypothetical protein GCM10011312_15910 [Planktosalinus lacus]